MAKNRNNTELTPPVLSELRDVADKGSRMVSWYAHPYDGTVRGGWCRWLRVEKGVDDLPDHIASVYDEVEHVAAAVNNFIPLLELVDDLKKEIELLRQYGNKDCISQTDEAIAKIPKIKYRELSGKVHYLTLTEWDIIKQRGNWKDLAQEERMDTFEEYYFEGFDDD